MGQIDVIAVVGSCVPERLRYAKRLAESSKRMFIPANRLAISPDPVDEAMALAPWADQSAGAVLEFPARSEVTEVIGALAAPDAETRLSDVVAVVDAAHLLDDLGQDGYVFQPMHSARSTGSSQRSAPNRYMAHAMLAVTQLEYASVVMLVNWECLATDDLSTVMALVSHLTPLARLRLAHGQFERPQPGAPYTAVRLVLGWSGTGWQGRRWPFPDDCGSLHHWPSGCPA